MKVLLVFDGSINVIGGAQTFARNMIKIYKQLGYSIRVICTEGKPSRDVVILPSLKVLGRTILFGDIGKVLEEVKNSDIIHLFYCESVLHLFVALAAKFLQKKIISSPLASITYFFHHSIVKRMIAIPIVFIKCLVALLSDIVHVAAFYDLLVYRRIVSESKVFMIPHGLLSSQQEKPINLPNCELRICFLGRFKPDKGSHIAIKALEILRKLGYNACLIVIGSQDCLSSNYFSERRIFFTGFLREDEKNFVIKHCDVGIIPSLSDPVEAFSIALSEFNRLGIPVVASDIGALRFRMRPYAGVLVKPRDPFELSKGILLARKLKGKVKKLPDVIDLKQEALMWKELLKRLQENYGF